MPPTLILRPDISVVIVSPRFKDSGTEPNLDWERLSNRTVLGSLICSSPWLTSGRSITGRAGSKAMTATLYILFSQGLTQSPKEKYKGLADATPFVAPAWYK